MVALAKGGQEEVRGRSRRKLNEAHNGVSRYRLTFASNNGGKKYVLTLGLDQSASRKG